jgi:sarcosine oxidase
LLPELCVKTYLELARSNGAATRFGERVLEWAADGDGVLITTNRGTYRAGRLVLTAGAWLPEIVSDLPLPLAVERQMFHWFEPSARRDLHRAERCPLSLWEFERGRMVATFPDLGDGVKAGVHHEGEMTDPATVRRTTSAPEDAEIREILSRLMPDAAGPQLESRVCLYTNTPDRDFLIDAHPGHANVLIVSPCSGHGFKFASAIGEIVAEIVAHGKSRFDLAPFRLDRFNTTADYGLRAAG